METCSHSTCIYLLWQEEHALRLVVHLRGVVLIHHSLRHVLRMIVRAIMVSAVGWLFILVNWGDLRCATVLAQHNFIVFSGCDQLGAESGEHVEIGALVLVIRPVLAVARL